MAGSDMVKLPMAEPEVIASLVSYIAKPEAYFITGTSPAGVRRNPLQRGDHRSAQGKLSRQMAGCTSIERRESGSELHS